MPPKKLVSKIEKEQIIDNSTSGNTETVITMKSDLDMYTLWLNLSHDVMHDFNLQGMCNRIYKNLLAIRNVVPTTLWNSNIVTYSNIIKSKGAKYDTALLINFIKSEGDDDEDGDMQSGGTKQEIEDFLKEYFEKNMYLDDIQTENYNQNELYAAILNVGTIITSYLGSVKKDNFLRLSSTATAAATATSTTTGMDVEYGDEQSEEEIKKRPRQDSEDVGNPLKVPRTGDADSQSTDEIDSQRTYDAEAEARMVTDDGEVSSEEGQVKKVQVKKVQ